MIVQDRKPRDGHREDFRKFLEPMFDPAFTVEGPFPKQEGAAHTARHAVIPASHRSINQMRTRGRHGRISWDHPHNLTLRARRVNIAMPALSIFPAHDPAKPRSRQ